MAKLSHFDKKGHVRMVDVSDKATSFRRAKARARLRVGEELFEKLKENKLEKGDAFAAARIAGIQAAKRTAELIPLCHPLPLTYVNLDISLEPPDHIQILSEVRTQANTGVEMEALTAASVAALTVYDMGKAVDRNMIIEEVLLMEKEGGRSGSWKRNDKK